MRSPDTSILIGRTVYTCACCSLNAAFRRIKNWGATDHTVSAIALHHLVQLHQDEMRLFGRMVELTHLYAWKSMVS